MVFQNLLRANEFILKIDLWNTLLTLQETEYYKENRNPEPFSPIETRKIHTVIYVHQSYRTKSWPLDLRYECWSDASNPMKRE